MVLLLDTTQNNGADKSLLEKVRKVVASEQVEMFQSFNTLLRFLTSSVEDREILVLRPASAGELIEFMQIRNLMRDVQILLVAPDREPETIFLVHLLHPRYLAHEDGNFDDLASVLERILARRRQEES